MHNKLIVDLTNTSGKFSDIKSNCSFNEEVGLNTDCKSC